MACATNLSPGPTPTKWPPTTPTLPFRNCSTSNTPPAPCPTNGAYNRRCSTPARASTSRVCKGGKLPTEESLDRLISGSIIAQTDYMRLLQQDEPQPAAQPAQPVEDTHPAPTHKSEPAPARKSPAEHENKPQAAPSEPAADDTFFTESLAKIYIKQRRYEKALQIIKKLSLKYPEKNIYFADQIRFLEKLIINIKTE